MSNGDRIVCEDRTIEVVGSFDCDGSVLTRGDYGDSIRRAFVGVDDCVYVWDSYYGWFLLGVDCLELRRELGEE